MIVLAWAAQIAGSVVLGLTFSDAIPELWGVAGVFVLSSASFWLGYAQGREAQS
jgi:hypothetical protein